jgi:hypothetical protein
MKLKYSQIAQHRAQLQQEQNNQCALCGDSIEQGSAVLDHCHKTGVIRAVLHRGCNSMLGKIENNMPRSQLTPARLRVLAERLLDYIESTRDSVIHPTHLTPEEKKLKAYKKKKKKPVKKGY